MLYQYNLLRFFLFRKYPETVRRTTAAFTLLSVAVILSLDTHGAVPPDILHGPVFDSSLKLIADDSESQLEEVRVDGIFSCDDRPQTYQMCLEQSCFPTSLLNIREQKNDRHNLVYRLR